MVKNIREIEINNETLKLYIKTLNSVAGLGKKLRSPKFLFIDWDGYQEVDFSFEMFDEDDLHTVIGNIDLIDDDEFVSELYKTMEDESESFLWNDLVENSRHISNDFYLKNTYDENLIILHKIRERNLKIK